VEPDINVDNRPDLAEKEGPAQAVPDQELIRGGFGLHSSTDEITTVALPASAGGGGRCFLVGRGGRI